MVKIRLARGGAKKNPFYSIVATDSRKRRDSGYIERIGYFNPVARGQEVRLQLEEDRLSYWISQGAQISDRVKQLVKEYKDPSIREKQLAMQAAKADEKAKKIAAEEKAKADLEAKEAAEAAAQEAAAEEAAAEEAEAEAPAAEAEAEAPAAEAEAEAPAEEAPAAEAEAEAPAEEAPAEEAPAEEAAEKPAEEPEEK
jgi:small subunit ribosomal protein S16